MESLREDASLTRGHARRVCAAHGPPRWRCRRTTRGTEETLRGRTEATSVWRWQVAGHDTLDAGRQQDALCARREPVCGKSRAASAPASGFGALTRARPGPQRVYQ